MARPHPPARTSPIADETGTLYRRAPVEVALCYPNTYRVAGSSLGLQVVYRALNSHDDLACHRFVMPEEALEGMRPPPLRSLEYGKPLGDYDAICVSIAYELDLAHLVAMLEASGIPSFASERGPKHPPIVVGGPLTTSNVLPLGLIADVVVMGEADLAIYTLRDWLVERPDTQALCRLAATHPGFWVPAVHGDAVPNQISVATEHLPALGAWHSPQAEFKRMMLLETSRGCPRYCKFCVVRAPVAPVRDPVLEKVVAALDLPEYQQAPRVGFVGAAVSDWAPIKDALRAAVERGKEVGISSLRADKLDEEFVGLLHQGGYRTLTVASDAPSQRMRGKMMKGIRERHLVGAAELARAAGMRQFKMYVIVGLPDETFEDLDELIDLGRRLGGIIGTSIGISPFVPKLHTPLAQAPFEAIPSLTDKLRRIQRGLGGKVEVRADSPRWAWIEYRLSHGGMETAHAVREAVQRGGTFAAWKGAFAKLDQVDGGEERRAVAAALRHDLWPLTGAR